MKTINGGTSNKPTMSKTLLIGYAGIVVLGLVDCLTGSEISFSIFYVLPVSLIAWRVGLRAGCLSAFIGAGAWMLADRLTGHQYSHPAILYWNTAVRLGFFLIITVSLHLRRTAERDLKRTQARLAALFKFTPDSIIVLDGGNRIMEANEQAVKVFGYTRDELLGMSAERLLAARFQSPHPDQPRYIADPKRHPVQISQDLRGQRKDGGEFPIEIVLAPMEDTGPHQLMVAFREVSGRRLMEAQLREYRDGKHHTECEDHMTRLKSEVNALLNELQRPKRYLV